MPLDNNTSVDSIISELVSILAGRENIDESSITQLLDKEYPELTSREYYLIEKSVSSELRVSQLISQIKSISDEIYDRLEIRNDFNISDPISSLINNIQLLIERVNFSILPDIKNCLSNKNEGVTRCTGIFMHMNNTKTITNAYEEKRMNFILKKIARLLLKFSEYHSHLNMRVYKDDGPNFFIVYACDIETQTVCEHFEMMKKLPITHRKLSILPSHLEYPNNEINIGMDFSAGISRVTDGNMYALLKQAQQALAVSKEGKIPVVFDSTMDTTSSSQEYLKNQELVTLGFKHGLFKVHYQPIVQIDKMQSGDPIVIYEALIRLINPYDNTILFPGAFMEPIEKLGKQKDLTNELIKQSISLLKDNPGIRLTFNITGFELAIPNRAQEIFEQIHRNGIDASRMTVEIPENIIELTKDILNNINKFIEYGFSIALDDVGHGHNNLSRIGKFRAKYMKIDRSLISGIDKNNDKFIILQGLISIAVGIGMKVVVEGIETIEELDMIKSLNDNSQDGKGKIHAIQGWYFGKAMPNDEILKNVK